MSRISAPPARTIARMIPQCPSCGCDEYCAVFKDGPEAFSLQSLRCEQCEEDILACFLRLPANARDTHWPQQVSERLKGLIWGSCVAAIVLLGWMMLVEAGSQKNGERSQRSLLSSQAAAAE